MSAITLVILGALLLAMTGAGGCSAAAPTSEGQMYQKVNGFFFYIRTRVGVRRNYRVLGVRVLQSQGALEKASECHGVISCLHTRSPREGLGPVIITRALGAEK